MGISVMMAATGAIGLASVDDIDHAGDIFVGLYMMYVYVVTIFFWYFRLTLYCVRSLFAAILFIFETIQIRPCDFPQRVYKRNFGFLYGVKGKAIFMILYVHELACPLWI